MWDEDYTDLSTGPWRYLLPGLLLFLSFMMVSEVKYPSFKTLDLRARRTFAKTVFAIIFRGCLGDSAAAHPARSSCPSMFTIYLLYGFIRPRISRKVRHEIEEEEEDDGRRSAPLTCSAIPFCSRP